jgi:hypothetical protein
MLYFIEQEAFIESMTLLDNVAKSKWIRHTPILILFTKVAAFRCKLPVVGGFLMKPLDKHETCYYFV